MAIQMDDLLQVVVDEGASDLHIRVGVPPVIRLHGSMVPIDLPPSIKDLLFRPRGLILVTGPTGSGKTTTLASMIDIINTERDCHIITVEDPIEYYHYHKKSVVT